MVFDAEWFKQHQWWLLPYASRNRDNLFIGTNKPLVEIAPDHVTWEEEKGLYSTEFHVHHVYGRRLYARLSPLWNLMHRIDMSTFGRSVGLNFGFDTLTRYPDAHAETSTVDGYVNIKSTYGTTWSALRSATTGTASADDGTSFICAGLQAHTTTDKWYWLYHGFFLYDTSALTSSATISAATLSLYWDSGASALGTMTTHVVSSSPASNTALVKDDYEQVGSTSFGSINSYGAAYNDISLNASGLANISKTGISKFGTLCGWDFDNSAPTWVSGANSYFTCRGADDTTVNNGKDPKLVVTYSVSSTFVPRITFF